MGKVVAGFACSHIVAAEHFAPLKGETREDVVRKVDHVVEGLTLMGTQLKEASPDALIVFADDHIDNFSFHNVFPFCIRLGYDSKGMGTHPYPKDYNKFITGKDYKVHDELANLILRRCIENDFDLSFSTEAQLDHAFLIPLHFIMPEREIPLVPVWVNCLIEPQPRPKRCYKFGQLLAEVIRDSNCNVGVLATGGLSHFPQLDLGRVGEVNTEFDKRLLELLEEGDGRRVSQYSYEELAEAGEHELLNWMCLLGMVGNSKARVLAYEHVDPIGLAAVSWYPMAGE